jgi:transposase
VLPYAEPVPEKQWWYRPADSKTRKIVEKIVVMDAAGQKDAEIAKRLKTSEGTIRQCRYIAKKNGWLRTNEDDELEMVDVEAEMAMTVDRKIVRNIDASLDGQMTNWQTHEMTIAAAKGRGIFKGDSKGGDANGSVLPVVAIQVIMPSVGAGDQKVVEENIGGTPAYVEGEVDTPEGA